MERGGISRGGGSCRVGTHAATRGRSHRAASTEWRAAHTRRETGFARGWGSSGSECRCSSRPPKLHYYFHFYNSDSSKLIVNHFVPKGSELYVHIQTRLPLPHFLAAFNGIAALTATAAAAAAPAAAPAAAAPLAASTLLTGLVITGPVIVSAALVAVSVAVLAAAVVTGPLLTAGPITTALLATRRWRHVAAALLAGLVTAVPVIAVPVGPIVGPRARAGAPPVPFPRDKQILPTTSASSNEFVPFVP